MEKQPFTTAGVSALQNWLYGLTNAALEAEVLAMQADFTSWVLTYFELDETQLTYLNSMSAVPLNFLAANATFAVAHRLPINLIQEVLSNNLLFDDKLFEPKSNFTVTSHSNGNYEVDGDLTITVNYVA